MRQLVSMAVAFALFAPGLAVAQDGDKPAEKPPETKPAEQPATPDKPAEAKPAAPHKASIAVLPFSFTEVVRRSDDGCTKRYLHEFDTSILTNKFITALVNTQKFDVVDRDKIDKILKEQQFGDTGALDPARCVKAGKMIGADYFLTGAISYFVVGMQSIENPYARGNYTHTVTAEIRVDMRITDTRTSKIVAAERGDSTITTKFQSGTLTEVGLAPRLLDDLQRDLCQTLSVKTIDGVYPIKVIKWKDGVAYLNRGEGGGFQQGDLLDVWEQGEELVDPDTGASLGSSEKKIGTLRVTAIEKKFSKAELVGGAEANIPTGAICRKPKARPAGEQPQQGGGRGPGGW